MVSQEPTGDCRSALLLVTLNGFATFPPRHQRRFHNAHLLIYQIYPGLSKLFAELFSDSLAAGCFRRAASNYRASRLPFRLRYRWPLAPSELPCFRRQSQVIRPSALLQAILGTFLWKSCGNSQPRPSDQLAHQPWQMAADRATRSNAYRIQFIFAMT